MLYDAQSLYLYSQKYLHVLKENCTYRNLFLQFVIGSTIRGWRLMYAELKTIPVCLLIHIYQFINVSNLVQKKPKTKNKSSCFLIITNCKMLTHSGRVPATVSWAKFLTLSLTTWMPLSSEALSSSTLCLYSSGLKTETWVKYEQEQCKEKRREINKGLKTMMKKWLMWNLLSNTTHTVYPPIKFSGSS